MSCAYYRSYGYSRVQCGGQLPFWAFYTPYSLDSCLDNLIHNYLYPLALKKEKENRFLLTDSAQKNTHPMLNCSTSEQGIIILR